MHSDVQMPSKVGPGLPDVPKVAARWSGWPGETRRAQRGLCEKPWSRGFPWKVQAAAPNSWERSTESASLRGLLQMAASSCPRPLMHVPPAPRAPRKPRPVRSHTGIFQPRSAALRSPSGPLPTLLTVPSGGDGPGPASCWDTASLQRPAPRVSLAPCTRSLK